MSWKRLLFFYLPYFFFLCSFIAIFVLTTNNELIPYEVPTVDILFIYNRKSDTYHISGISSVSSNNVHCYSKHIFLFLVVFYLEKNKKVLSMKAFLLRFCWWKFNFLWWTGCIWVFRYLEYQSSILHCIYLYIQFGVHGTLQLIIKYFSSILQSPKEKRKWIIVSFSAWTVHTHYLWMLHFIIYNF